MSRNMTAANQEIFDRLKAWVPRVGLPLSNTVIGTPYFVTTNKAGKQWLKSSRIVADAHLFGTARAFSMEMGNEHIFCIAGVSEMDLDQDHFLDIDSEHPNDSPLGGLVTVALTHVLMNPNVSPHAVLDQVLIDQGDTAPPVPIDPETIRAIFPALRFFRIKPESPLATSSGLDLHRIVSWIAAGNSPVMSPLAFAPPLIAIAQEAILAPPPSYPFSCMYAALTATRWEYALLEFYRAIERLFAIPSVADFCAKTGLDSPVLEVIRDLEISIGWRPKEEDALSTIFCALPETVLTELAAALPGEVAPTSEGSLGKNVGRRVYKLRNSIVHYRTALGPISINDENWNAIIKGMAATSFCAYQTLSSHLA